MSTIRPVGRGAGWIWPGILVVIGLVLVVGVVHGELTGPISSTASPAPTAPAATSSLPMGADLPRNSLIAWSHGEHPGETTYAAGDLRLTLTVRDQDGLLAPVLTIRAPNGPPLEIVGKGGFATDASAQLGVGRIDPAAEGDQIIFTSYTGGAHCCTDVLLIEKLGGAWRQTHVASQDGDRLVAFPADADGDGRPEFALSDDRFLYAFASYAASLAPPKVLTVDRGVVADVSAAPRYRKLFAADLDAARTGCVAEHNNGACAAYAGLAARLGSLDAVWAEILDGYDRNADWTYPTACRVDDSKQPCPEDQTVAFSGMPEALLWFLGQSGYSTPIYVAPAGATGPSFTCGGPSEIVALICATPELAKADRDLAEAYGRALAQARDPAAVRQAQRTFLASRNNAPPDAIALLRLYQAQQEALGSE